ncbi:MAG TPA: glycosyltransferase family A protein [Terriglobia bacterium]|nr:glycosyltransferase family A protein [Terriglobia bacterium]
MRISVILWTYNRCQTLPNALSSVAASNLPESVEWEVLVLDNNSRDQTREVMEDFCRRYPSRIRYLFEPRQEKSHALNAGVREARGQVLAFVDDDVTGEPSWLHNLTAPLKDAQWAGTGGRTLLQRGFSPPPWLGLREPYNLGEPLPDLIWVKNHLSSPGLRPEPIWPFAGRCFRNTVASERTWAGGQAA